MCVCVIWVILFHQTRKKKFYLFIFCFVVVAFFILLKLSVPLLIILNYHRLWLLCFFFWKIENVFNWFKQRIENAQNEIDFGFNMRKNLIYRMKTIKLKRKYATKMFSFFLLFFVHNEKKKKYRNGKFKLTTPWKMSIESKHTHTNHFVIFGFLFEQWKPNGNKSCEQKKKNGKQNKQKVC